MAISEDILKNFLIKNGIPNFQLEKINSDASFRNYYRILNKDLLIMHAPQNKGESLNNFINVNKILKSIDLSVSTIYDVDYQNDLMLIEDFGDDIFSKIFNSENEENLYKEAIKLLSFIINHKKLKISHLEKYSLDILINESNLFIEWYLQKDLSLKISDLQKEEFSIIIEEIYNSLNMKQDDLVLRDFHVDNLIYLKNRSSFNKIGLIDYQDALVGSHSYDLTSLIEDVRRPISSNLKVILVELFSHLTSIDINQLEKEISFYSVQRNLKIIGIFSRLKHRDNKNHYFSLIDNAWGFINPNLEKPKFKKLKNWMNNILVEHR